MSDVHSDISHDQHAVRRQKLAEMRAGGFDPDALPALAGDAQVKQRLKDDTQEAVARGVFGAPTFFVDGEMYWGQDRLDFVKEALEADTP